MPQLNLSAIVNVLPAADAGLSAAQDTCDELLEIVTAACMECGVLVSATCEIVPADEEVSYASAQTESVESDEIEDEESEQDILAMALAAHEESKEWLR